MSRDVYFETITTVHRRLVKRCLSRGDRVFVYDFTQRLKATPWLADLLNRGRVERIYVTPLSRADHEAIRATEWLYPQVSHHPLVRRLHALFGRDECEAVLKRALLDALFPYFFIRLDLERRRDPARVSVLVPCTYLYWQRALERWPEAPAPLSDLRIPFLAATWSAWTVRMQNRQRGARVVASALLAVARARIASARGARPPLREFDHLYAIEQPFQTKFEGARRFDFLIDDDRLTRKNTAFLVSAGLDGPWAEQAARDGLEIIRRRDYAGFPAPAEGAVARRPAYGRLAVAMLAAVGAPGWLYEAGAIVTYVALYDAPLLERVRFKNYIYMNQDTVLQGWRNALLRRHGVESWSFVFSIGGGYLYTDGPEADHRFWAYQNPDHLVAPGRRVADYFRGHHQRIAHYDHVGNIWSTLVLEVERRAGRTALLRQWFPDAAAVRSPVVAWFDTSFVQADTSPSTYDEAIAWYSDIERFLVDFPDVRVVIKPSKDESYFLDDRTPWWDVRGARLVEIWRRLREHPRVYFAGHAGDPPSVIAASDLVITFCFSSCSAEALGAGRRAIWYEPGERQRQTLLGRVPGLVCHGYLELRTYARAVLSGERDARLTAEEIERFRGVVDDFLDGGGLTRFRDLLAKRAGP
jgi:hypothetical protein